MNPALSLCALVLLASLLPATPALAGTAPGVAQGEVPELVFADGFEGGLCGTWSAFTGDAGEGCESAACRPTIAAPGGRVSIVLGPHTDSGSCGGAGSEGYAVLELDETSDVFATTHQEIGMDTVLYLRAAGCAGTEVACSDDADGLVTSKLALTNVPAGTYHLFVDTETTSTATLAVDVYITAPGASSDRCGQPTFLPAATTSVTGTTCGYSADYAPSATLACQLAGSGTGDAVDRVYYFVVSSASTVTFSGCTAGTSYDQTLFVRSVCTEQSSQSGCNDDGCGGAAACTGSYRSALSQALSPGVYYLFVDGFQPSACPCGGFELSVTGL